ncbi:MAG: hypothetical protein CXT70_00010 [Methanobacteriota archaeon]|nr:MAG: hypothetical protein CXT70_00010 [Euryarchaeota archaeon]
MSPPPRAKHLWRYTPWPRIQPQEGVPIAEKIVFTVNGNESLDSGAPRVVLESEIARVFLSEEGDVGLVHIQARASGHVVAGHLHINCKGNSTVILHLTGEADWSGLYVSGEVADNCKLAYGFVNELSNDCKLLHCEDWSVGRDATMEIAALSVGGFRSKSDIRTALTGEGATLKQAITVHGLGARHIDNHIEINHKVANCNSKLVINSACAGSSRSIATKGANGTDAGQVFRNLLLSDKARADSIPELEVLADEVKAAHGAASAPVNPQQVHYLMSRGLSPQQAEALIVEGFLIDAFSCLTDIDLKGVLATRMTIHLECELKR